MARLLFSSTTITRKKPGPNEEARARAFISDVVEDYFMTYDGERFIGLSQVISIS